MDYIAGVLPEKTDQVIHNRIEENKLTARQVIKWLEDEINRIENDLIKLKSWDRKYASGILTGAIVELEIIHKLEGNSDDKNN